MRTRHLSALAAVLLLAACGTNATTGEPEQPTTPTPVASQATEEPTTEAPTSVQPPAPEPVDPCEAHAPETTLAEDIMAVEVPDGITITDVTENRPDSDIDQSLTWIRAELCGDDISADEHRVIATDIAIAARDAEQGGDRIWRLSVGLWIADDAGEIEQGRSLYVEDFPLYTWDRGAARPPEGIWEDNSI